MRTIIYYFSGRGNSYHTARSLAERLQSASICPMVYDAAAGEDDCIGIVTPVIDVGIPSHVRKFLKKLTYSGNPYVFAIVTCGGLPAASMSQLKNALHRKGLKLSAGFVLKFGLEPWGDTEWNAQMDEIADIVRNQREGIFPKEDFKDKLLSTFANPLARVIVPNEDKKFRVTEKCRGCGTCAKLCPAANIEIRGGKPVWLHRCTQCAACFGWCPNEAIEGSNLAARTRYTNPHVTLKDMLISREI